ncbi:MAG: hypothetical protein QXY52_00475 [Conexivisphaerales archaeon]
MKFSIERLSRLALIKVNSEEKKEIEQRITALRELLKNLEEVELPKESIILVSEGLYERDDIPEQFDSESILNGFNSVKGRYIKAPKTL